MVNRGLDHLKDERHEKRPLSLGGGKNFRLGGEKGPKLCPSCGESCKDLRLHSRVPVCTGCVSTLLSGMGDSLGDTDALSRPSRCCLRQPPIFEQMFEYRLVDCAHILIGTVPQYFSGVHTVNNYWWCFAACSLVLRARTWTSEQNSIRNRNRSNLLVMVLSLYHPQRYLEYG